MKDDCDDAEQKFVPLAVALIEPDDELMQIVRRQDLNKSLLSAEDAHNHVEHAKQNLDARLSHGTTRTPRMGSQQPAITAVSTTFQGQRR